MESCTGRLVSSIQARKLQFIVCGISKEIDPVSYRMVCSSGKVQIHKTIPGIFLICGSFVDT